MIELMVLSALSRAEHLLEMESCREGYTAWSNLSIGLEPEHVRCDLDVQCSPSGSPSPTESVATLTVSSYTLRVVHTSQCAFSQHLGRQARFLQGHDYFTAHRLMLTRQLLCVSHCSSSLRILG